MNFRGFFTRSTPAPLVTIPQPSDRDLAANEAAFEALPSWMVR